MCIFWHHAKMMRVICEEKHFHMLLMMQETEEEGNVVHTQQRWWKDWFQVCSRRRLIQLGLNQGLEEWERPYVHDRRNKRKGKHENYTELAEVRPWQWGEISTTRLPFFTLEVFQEVLWHSENSHNSKQRLAVWIHGVRNVYLRGKSFNQETAKCVIRDITSYTFWSSDLKKPRCALVHSQQHPDNFCHISSLSLTTKGPLLLTTSCCGKHNNLPKKGFT